MKEFAELLILNVLFLSKGGDADKDLALFGMTKAIPNTLFLSLLCTTDARAAVYKICVRQLKKHRSFFITFDYKYKHCHKHFK